MNPTNNEQNYVLSYNNNMNSIANSRNYFQQMYKLNFFRIPLEQQESKSELNVLKVNLVF